MAKYTCIYKEFGLCIGQDSVQASQVNLHQTMSSMSLQTLLCALVDSHVGTGRGCSPIGRDHDLNPIEHL